MGTAARLVSALLRAFRPSSRALAPTAPPRSRSTASAPLTPGQGSGESATVEIAPPRRLTLSYAPQRDGAPDGGEIVWTWVPYEERDGRGKDRPVLIIGRADATRSYAVRLTSKPHAGDADYLALGTGEWDPQRRPSWVDIEQLYLVHDAGMRREAATLDRRRFDAVASALRARYGWTQG
ncbi:MAG: PemK domain-containing protein [Microbacterium sp. 71-36]|uniref:type II toxin-antitoxin system PemK/MazF family toxin n=1 Tax=unclassified Microbacterium TaxID=2609290 RepID=UPI00086AD0A5|nr:MULTISPECIES: type II toxin-antitoxin system PemK/MazF family toxin [unclassified Microbacterium]MBN9210669.1 type II toxin-antitoxin system PemK/MazF family toxin [Microbacterium sp.]ODT39045.1 MAG: PemK domain-containing protein [Microbacterium sp. SCN 71-17]OJV76950.1 MAG: PemK domain-containing protein [Microbacterium sp. 71-36]